MPSERDLRVIRTKKAINDAFIDLMQTKPFNSITIQEIADHAMINRATFYAHYQDKYDLMEKHAIEVFSELDELVDDTYPGGDSQNKTEQLTSMLLRFFEHIAFHASFYKIIFLNNDMFQYRLKFEATLQEKTLKKLSLLKRGRYKYRLAFKEDLLDELFSKYLVNACIGVFSWWLENDLIYSPQHMSNIFGKLSTMNFYELYGFNFDANRDSSTPERNS